MNRPQTLDGLLVWDVVTRCGGQWRAAPGAIVGLDMTAVLAIGAAMDVPALALAEMVPSIEAAAIREFGKRGDTDG